MKQQQGDDGKSSFGQHHGMQRDCSIVVENFLRQCTRTFMRKILRTNQRLPLWVHDCRVIQHLQQLLLQLRCSQQEVGDRNMDHTALSYIVLPLSIYALQGIWRLRNDLSTDNSNKPVEENLGSLANILGLMALVAMSILLVPVSRHSPILKLLGWSPAVAVRLHQWTGRVVILGGFLHGFMYLYKWKFLEKLRLTDMIIPPASCWSMVDFTVREKQDGACYKPMRNLTGVVALLGLVTIAMTSLEVIRRSFFVAFYTSHLVAGPLVFMMVILHWNRSFLYLGGGLLYYLATTLVVYYECKIGSSNKSGGGVRILSVERIRCVKDSCVSLTFQASESAIERFRASQYVNMLAPEISLISHPFTINIVPGDFPNDADNGNKAASMYKNTYRMQVIFREMGPFTRQLSSRLMDSRLPILPPVILDGFHGPSDRLQVVLEHHDVVVFVAGGIGITPYLTMLHQMYENLASSYSWEVKEQQQPIRRPSKFSLIATTSSFKTKKIMLHWICRDKGLIEYVQREYFSALLKLGSTNKSTAGKFNIQIIVHRTSKSFSGQQPQPEHLVDKNNLSDTHITARRGITEETGCTPFRPSKFAAGSKKTYLANLPLLTSFCLIGWLGFFIVWKCYSTIQDKAQLGSRSVSILVLFCYLPAAATVINLIFTHAWEDRTGESSEYETRALVSRGNDGASHNVGLEPPCIYSTGDGNAIAPVVTMEEREGRPSIPDMLNAFDEDHVSSPALYACGPTLLMQRIKSAIREQCCIRAQRCTMVAPRIAYYEESFEM
jgi:predicted ferric reductase